MKPIKLSYIILIVFLVGCQAAGFVPAHSTKGVSGIIELTRIISDQVETSNLAPSERCEKIHVDLRADCRKKVKKELDELTEAVRKSSDN